MRIKLVLVAAIAMLGTVSCESPQAVNNSAPKAGTAITSSPSPVMTPAAAATPVTPKDGDYAGKGVVTQIKLEGQGSVEMNHEEIKDVMPAMQMEFFVSDKKLLNGLKAGDKVDFILRYKNHTETIVGIKKTQ